MEAGGLRVRDQFGLHITTLSLKYEDWGCNSVLEYLLSMHKVLCFIPRTVVAVYMVMGC